MIKSKLSVIILVVFTLIISFVLFFINIKKDESDIIPFSDLSFCRDNGSDSECIYFGSDNQFSYYEVGSGNPVMDSDLCPNYTYSSKENNIKVKCEGIKPLNIKVISYSDDEIELNIKNKIVKFYKENSIE